MTYKKIVQHYAKVRAWDNETVAHLLTRFLDEIQDHTPYKLKTFLDRHIDEERIASLIVLGNDYPEVPND